MNKKLILKNKKEIKTMSDPYVVDIIQVFRKNSNNALTVKDISNVLNEPHGKVYYHIKKLETIGALKLEHTENINGIIAKYYKLDFDEIYIKYEDNNDANKEIELNYALNMISKFYDDSKNEFINYIKKVKGNKKKEELNLGEKNSTLTSSNLYFTEESYKQFSKEFKGLIDKYSIKQNKPDEFKKTIFLSIYSEL